MAIKTIEDGWDCVPELKECILGVYSCDGDCVHCKAGLKPDSQIEKYVGILGKVIYVIAGIVSVPIMGMIIAMFLVGLPTPKFWPFK